MPYNIQIDEDIVYLRFYGESNVEENQQARQEIVSINESAQCYKVLVDWQQGSIATNVSALDFSRFASSFPQAVDTKPYVVAVIISKANKEVHFGIDFSTSIAKDAGLMTRIFWQLEEAVDWLKHLP